MSVHVPNVLRLPGKTGARRFTAKTYLKLLMGVGLIALVGGGAGTFASFNATVSNPATFATGTLVLSDTANAVTCLSTGGGTTVNASNTNSSCTGAPVNVSLEEPGSSATGAVTLLNAGSLNASGLTLTATCAAANASGQTYNGTGNLCTGTAPNVLEFYVQEWVGGPPGTGTPYDCLYGATTGLGTTCTFSTSATLGSFASAYPSGFSLKPDPGIDSTTSALSTGSPITSLPVAALTEAVSSGDTITVVSGTHTQTFTTTAAAAVGATSLAITSATPNFAYPIGSSVADTTTNAWPAFPPTTAGGATRYFSVGLMLPTTADNTVQGLAANATLTWQETQ